MNIVAKNKIPSSSSVLNKQMQQIYQGYTTDALSEVKKIRNDKLLQAFKKKVKVELKCSSTDLLADKALEDTASHINLLERALKLQKQREEESSLMFNHLDDTAAYSTYKHVGKLESEPYKKQIYLMLDET